MTTIGEHSEHERDMEMYGWSPNDKQHTTKHKEPQTLIEEPRDPANEPPTLIIEEPTSALDLNREHDGNREAPQTLNDEPEEDIGDGPSSANFDNLVIEEEVMSSEELDDDKPDGSGSIKPYIRFTDRFPSDLSWSEIKVAP